MPVLPPRVAKKKGIWGCNWGIRKNTLLAINGFDEDYVHAGIGEDVDVEWRLRKTGCKFYYLPQRLIVYHLHHDSNYTQEEVNININLLREKQRAGLIYCSKGLQNTKEG